ncbi:MAG: cell wall-active antibiotics response protein LiaF [Dehalococcoidia bacterium]|nr:cell wall-active antibiotics response protein LiaF [Dehalococcoidia bacterium]
MSGRPGAAVGNIRIGNGDWDLRDMDTGIGMGELRLDLSHARIPGGETNLRLKGGMGKIQIVVPAGLSITAHAEVVLGSISLLGHKEGGISRQLSFTSPNYAAAERKVNLQLSLFMGEASIVRLG